jgi:hypothetical protein
VKNLVAVLANTLGLILTLALAVTVVSAADISGAWNVDGDVVGNPVKFACTLKQDGEKLSGTGKMQGKDIPISGSVKGQVVTFQFDVDHEGTTYTNVFTGKLGDNGVIEGSIAVGGVEGTFTAKKQ